MLRMDSGLEMAQSGRMLTLFAQYYRYTRDSATLLKYHDKIQGIVTMLKGRRAQAAGQYTRNLPLPVRCRSCELQIP